MANADLSDAIQDYLRRQILRCHDLRVGEDPQHQRQHERLDFRVWLVSN